MSFYVECKNIEKSFNSEGITTKVLRGVNLNLIKGEILMLVGPSGCGKTTFISIISGILSATHGDILIDGIDIGKLTDKERVLLRREKIGFIFQQYNLFPTLNVIENVSIPLLIQGVQAQKAHAESEKLLTALGLDNMGHRFPNQLSGGQQQRVAIARSLVHRPQLIICDEPTAALDEKSGHRVIALLKEAARDQGCAVIIVTHDHRIFSLADRVATMNDGVITDVKINHPA